MTMRVEWLRGCATALVTPFASGSEVDEAGVRALVERQIAGGVKLLVPCGTTGEAMTLTPEEHMHVVRLTVDVARGRARVIAGIGSNSTAVPELMVRLTDDALAGRWAAARETHYRLLPLMEANFLESSPGPVKAAMALMGLLDERFRLPLVPVQEKTRARLREVLQTLGALERPAHVAA